jgi:hypothetical protein
MANFTKSRFGSRPGPPSKGKSKTARKKSRNVRRPPKAPPVPKVVDYDDTGMEAAYLKSLIDDEKMVVVVLRTGEKLRGVVRYYDRDVFSLGPADGGPKLFLRKTGVRYLYEE